MGVRNAILSAVFRRYPELYWRRRGRTYYVQREESRCERLMHAAVVDRIAALQPKRVFEYGVGNASFLRKIHERLPGAECSGVDISPSQLAVGREAFPEAHLSTGDLTRLDVANNAFDVVVGLGVLIYVPPRRRAQVFRELHRVTAGHLIAVEYITRFFDDEMRRRFSQAGDFRYDYDIEQSIRAAGFVDVEAAKIAVTWNPATNPLDELPQGLIVARK